MKKIAVGIVIAGLVVFFGLAGYFRYENAQFGKSVTGLGEKQSAHFVYTGYSAAEYKSFTKTSRYVAMPDGVKLATDIFLPADGPKRTSFPVIFIYNPYDRAYIAPSMPWWQRAFLWMRYGLSSPVFDQTIYDENLLFLAHGYALVVADMRGTGASFGHQMPFMLQVGQDGKDMIDWIASQKWCDGNVGMVGLSYRGWGELATAKFKPKALKAIMPEVIAFSGYAEGFRPGGILARRWIETYSDYLNAFNMNVFDEHFAFKWAPKATQAMLPTAPVFDENHDGTLTDEVTRNDDAYRRATMEHKDNMLFKDVAKQLPYIDSPAPAAYQGTDSIDSSPGYFAKDITTTGVAIYNLGGWFDGFIGGTVKLYATMAGKTPSKLLIAPKFHLPGVPEDYARYFHYQGNFKEQLAIERLRFFDHYLKGVDNGIDREPPVYIYVMNSGWRSENEWPLKRQVITPYYLGQDNRLSLREAADGIDAYQVDFTQSSSYGKNDVSRYLMMFTPDGVMDRTQKDKQCLVYDSGALGKDTEVTGQPIADLWVSSNQPDGDVYVYLTDVDENGRSLYVTEGQLRAGWNKLYNDDDQVRDVVNVLPDLPWHGFKAGTYEKDPLANGKVVELRFALLPTAWNFRQGHRLHVAIAGADYPDFELNPVLSPNDNPAEAPPTKLDLHRSAIYPSRIELPVIPPK